MGSMQLTGQGHIVVLPHQSPEPLVEGLDLGLGFSRGEAGSERLHEVPGAVADTDYVAGSVHDLHGVHIERLLPLHEAVVLLSAALSLGGGRVHVSPTEEAQLGCANLCIAVRLGLIGASALPLAAA